MAAEVTTANGRPPRSLIAWIFEPGLPRSTGLGPVRFTDPTHWTIPIYSSNGAKEPWECHGTYLTPEIVAAGKGTAVYYGTKYNCTEPVEYTVQAGMYFVVNPEEKVDAGSTTRSGVSQYPFVEGLSVPCANNNNGGWVPYDSSQLHGEPHSGTGTQTTVGCQINH